MQLHSRDSADLRAIAAAGELFEEVDLQCAAFVQRYAAQAYTAAAAAAVSAELGKGHVCLDLDNTRQYAPYRDAGVLPAPDVLAHRLHDDPAVVGAPGAYTPLIKDGSRIYLHRYHRCEGRIAGWIAAALAKKEREVRLDCTRMQTLFPAGDVDFLQALAPDARPHLQYAACISACTGHVCVISGGPGTGKTWTLVRILHTLQRQRPGVRIALAAPTGKAASRINESLHSDPAFDMQQVGEARTLHRLLGYRAYDRQFGHTRENPLAYDIVVIDEASMIDMVLMARCMDALEPDAVLILVGDKDQLASVEAGSVLADICAALGVNRFTSAFARHCNTCISTPLAHIPVTADRELSGVNRVIQLRRNYRFAHDSDIARVAALVSAGGPSQIDEALDIMHRQEGTCVFHEMADLPARFLETQGMPAQYTRFMQTHEPDDVLRCMHDFCILSPLQRGPFGVDAINQAMERLLARRYGLRIDEEFYDHRPLLVTENDYTLELYNGDTGVLLTRSHRDAAYAWFKGGDGTPRRISPVLLPAHTRTMYAMTVHKSQGSEFDRVVVVLPDRDTPVLTRELIYTAITRARRRVDVYGRHELLRTALGRSVSRSSGLAMRISHSHGA